MPVGRGEESVVGHLRGLQAPRGQRHEQLLAVAPGEAPYIAVGRPLRLQHLLKELER